MVDVVKYVKHPIDETELIELLKSPSVDSVTVYVIKDIAEPAEHKKVEPPTVARNVSGHPVYFPLGVELDVDAMREFFYDGEFGRVAVLEPANGYLAAVTAIITGGTVYVVTEEELDQRNVEGHDIRHVHGDPMHVGDVYDPQELDAVVIGPSERQDALEEIWRKHSKKIFKVKTLKPSERPAS